MEEPLPRQYFVDPETQDLRLPQNYIVKYLKPLLPSSDSINLEKQMQYTYKLTRYSGTRKPPKHSRYKKKFLTRKQKQELDLLKMPKNNWDFTSLQAMNKMWKDYMRHNLDLVKKAPSYQDQNWTSFSITLAKSELIGAEVVIVRSKVPSQVGITGIIVFETKMTLQIVTKNSKLKIILKENAVFKFQLDNMEFTVFGKHLVTRPSERSVKKIKSHMLPDI